MLNTQAFDMDNYQLDEMSRQGMKDIPMRTRVPMGYYDHNDFEGSLGGFSPPPLAEERRGIVVPGFVDRGTIRHEAAHTATNEQGDWPEVGQRLRDLHYADQEGDQATGAEARDWMHRMSRDQPRAFGRAVEHFKANPIAYDAPPAKAKEPTLFDQAIEYGRNLIGAN